MSKFDFVFTLGRPFSPFYSWLMTTRVILYQRNIFKRYSLPVPVISVGNLTMGGSGKTPVVMELAQFLKSHGYNPAIISRGYGGKPSGKYSVVTTGREVLLTPEEAGDEPFMLAEALDGIPVITGRARIHPSRYAIETLHSDIILLDDGFQNLAINRDIDLVLFNATTLAGNSRVFPAGVLREPVSALNRCHAFMLTGVTESNNDRVEKFGALLNNRFPDKMLFFAKFSQFDLKPSDETGDGIDISKMSKVYGFCAIANPVRFKDSIETTGVNLVQFTSFRDHKKYTQHSMDAICRDATACGADSLLTTEKDFVKIRGYRRSLPLYILKVQLDLGSRFEEYILKKLDNG